MNREKKHDVIFFLFLEGAHKVTSKPWNSVWKAKNCQEEATPVGSRMCEGQHWSFCKWIRK